jgi:hypothetical protein
MSKNLEDFRFNLIKNFNVEEIQTHIEKFDKEWLLNTHRQNQSDQTHRYTEAYYINLMVGNWKINNTFLTQNVSSDDKLSKLTFKIIDYLEKYHDGKVGAAFYVKLLKNSNVLEHIDDGDYLENVRRHHIAIKTNENVLFFVDGKSKNMKVGECWEINNNKSHKVSNDGEDRIHLIIDIMPNNKIKKKIL